MRILTVGSLYPPHHLGGYELVWRAAVDALRAAGHDARVLCTDTRVAAVEAADPPWVRRELRWYWRDHAFPKLSRAERRELERHNRAVLEAELAAGVDAVSWWAMGGMSMALVEDVRAQGIPAIGWVNDDWLIYGPTVDQSVGRLRRLRLADAARWVFCSESVRADAEQVRGPLADTAVHHQGVAAEFSATAPRPFWEGSLLAPGRLDPRKGLATAAAAVTLVPGTTLRVVGDGDPSVADALRGAERVVLEPGVPRSVLARFYAEADAVLFPVEWSEPWGLVPLEAMAVGRPVIATGRGGSAEYLVHEENCLIFAAGRPEALAAAIRRLAEDADLRDRLRAGGFATAGRLTEAEWLRAVVAEHERLAG